MGFEKLNTSKEAPGNKSQASFLKINKYEDPEMALGLISHICTSPKVINIEPYFERYNNLVEELNQDTNFEYTGFGNSNTIAELNNISDWCTYRLRNNISDTVEIAVAGGFSSGKSTMLNNILNIGKLLPTGIQPVSIVNTYMNCSSSNKNITIQGENIQNNIVSLNTEVLDCIQHSSKSKVYIASVLNRLLINVPTNAQLNEITFIDTPGYNNSNNINVENQTSDKSTLKNALDDADAVLWCIDSEGGGFSDSDIQILKEIKNKPIAIIFTKADKKGEKQHDTEIRKILKEAERRVIIEFGKDNNIKDIIAYSCAKNFSVSLHNKTIYDVISSLKNDINTSNLLDWCDNYIKNLLNEEIQESRKYLESLEEQRKEKSHEKNEYRKARNSNSNNNGGLKADLTDVFDDYDTIASISQQLFEICSDGIDRENEWREKSGIFSNTSYLDSAQEDAIDRYNELIELFKTTHNYNRDYFFEALSNQDIPEDTTGNDLETEYDIIVDKQKEERQFLGILQRYNLSIPSAFKEAYQKANADVQKHFKSLQGIAEHSSNDIFTAIRSGNYKDFLSCVSKGIDLTACDREGYSPLTLAAKMGDNQIINFYLDHDVDLSLKDRNGYNILETAVIYHYQDICQLIINKDKSLFRQSRSLVELAKKNNFIQWISNIR